MRTVLYSSAPTLERIQEQVRQFYCGSTVTLRALPDGTYSVSTGKGLCENVRIREARGRFRFEGVWP